MLSLLKKNSMLAAMFVREWAPANVDENGAYIIEGRNPYLFGYILRALENGRTLFVIEKMGDSFLDDSKFSDQDSTSGEMESKSDEEDSATENILDKLSTESL